MSLFNTHTLTFIEHLGGYSDTSGEYESAPTGTTVVAKGSWQPAVGSRRDNDETNSGKRDTKKFMFITKKKFLTPSESDNFWTVVDPAGQIGTFEITAHAPWRNGIISHEEYILTQIINDDAEVV